MIGIYKTVQIHYLMAAYFKINFEVELMITNNLEKQKHLENQMLLDN